MSPMERCSRNPVTHYATKWLLNCHIKKANSESCASDLLELHSAFNYLPKVGLFFFIFVNNNIEV